MYHTLLEGTFKVLASFDGTELLQLFDGDMIITFNMDDSLEKHKMMNFLSASSKRMKTLEDIAKEYEQQHTEQENS